MKKHLPNVTLIGIDCTHIDRLMMAADISTEEISFGSVKLLTSQESNDPRVIKIPHISSVEFYSDFIIKDLHKYIDTEFALVFQADGFILNPSAWSDSFLAYDYIGAPWYHLGDLRVGNGGFSLRSKKLIDWLAVNYKKIRVKINPEDVFISKFARLYLEQAGMVFAPESVASQFSFEGNERGVFWNGQFGFHGINYTDISAWLLKHPEYKSKLVFKHDDYTTLMKNYPIFDGTFHTFRLRKYDMKSFSALSKGKKNYEARMTKTKYDNFSEVKVGHTAIFKRSGVHLEDVPVPAFEKQITKIEHFNSFEELRKHYHNMYVTVPIKEVPKWKRHFIKILGDSAYPKDREYSIFWF